MTTNSKQRPPADPWDITLTYRHHHHWWYDADDAVETWGVSADLLDDSGTHVVTHVGDMSIVAVDLVDTRDPFSLLDGEDADLGAIAEVIFDPATSKLDPDLDQLLEPFGNRILILDSVRLTPEWRGFGLGVLLAGTAVKRLSGGVRAAVCYPAPIGDLSGDEPGASERQQAIASLGRTWAQLGFEHFRDGVYVLDLNLVVLDQSLQRLRASADQYRSFNG